MHDVKAERTGRGWDVLYLLPNTRAQLRRAVDSPQVRDAKRRQLQHVVSERPVERTRAGEKLPRPSHNE